MSLSTKIRNNLRRPLPDLCAFAFAKLISPIWARHLGRVGTRFHVSLGTRIQGGRSVHVGDRFYAGPSLWIEAVERYMGYSYSPQIRIGSHVTCSDFVHIAATTGVSIADGVLLGSRVHITDHSHGVYTGPHQDSPATPPAQRPLAQGKPVSIGANVWLGDGVVVLPGVSIGAGSIVGANSVVSRSLPAGVIAVGAPARAIKRYDAQSFIWVDIGTRS